MLKLGGELLEQPEDLDVDGARHRRAGRARRARRRARRRQGDRRRAGASRASPSARWTGCASPTRRRSTSVVAVLAGAINTRLVAAVRRAGGTAGRPDRRRRGGRDREARGTDRDASPAKRSTSGWWALPSATARPALLTDLLGDGATCRWSPASAPRATGQLLNVNADTLASHLAAALGATRLVIAGGTAGVLDAAGPHDRPADGARRGAADTAGHGQQGHGGEAPGLPRRAAAAASATCVIAQRTRRCSFDTLAARTARQRDCTQVVR